MSERVDDAAIIALKEQSEPVIRAADYEARRKLLERTKFEGFTQSHAMWLEGMGIENSDWTRDAIAAIGLPVENIQTVVFTENTRETKNVLGSWGIGGDETGKFRLYKLLNEIPVIAQVGTMAHEGAHANSPFTEDNDFAYGSKEARIEAAEHARAIAQQTIDTGVFLNGYHKALYRNYQLAKMTNGRDHADTIAARNLFDEETHTIMIELRFANPEHLKDVDRQQNIQMENLRRFGLHSGFSNTVSIVDGVDKTLVSLIAEVDDTEGLARHINGVRSRFAQEDRTLGGVGIRHLINERSLKGATSPKAA